MTLAGELVCLTHAGSVQDAWRGSLPGDELSEQISGALASALPISSREIAEEFVVTPAEDVDGFFLAERVDVKKKR